MTTFKYLDRLERIFQLIKFEDTGNAREFSEKIGISRRQLFYHLEELKTLGLPIKYNRNSNTYYLCEECEFKLEVKISRIEN